MDEWSELKDIFSKINEKIMENNIFIAGAAELYNEFSSDTDNESSKSIAKEFMSKLSYELVKHKNKIYSGYGIGVGDSIVSGAMSNISEENKDFQNYLEVLPFPQNIADKVKRNNIWEKNREYMISNSNVVLILFGNKKDTNTNKVIDSNGIIENEFKIAKELKKRIIPICSTGYAAKKVWNIINDNIHDYPYLQEHIAVLKTTKDINEIVKIIEKVKLFKY